MIEQLAAEGWSAWLYEAGETPTWLGVISAFAVDSVTRMFAWRATGDFITHAHQWIAREGVGQQAQVFSVADGRTFVFMHVLTPHEQELLAAWNADAAERVPNEGMIGAGYLIAEAA